MRVSQLLLHNNQLGHQIRALEAQLAAAGQACDGEQLRATVALLEAELRVEQQKLAAAEQRMAAAEMQHRETEVTDRLH